MNILGIGPAELLLVFILALIFIGPGKMPEVAASLGKAIREFQRASAELTSALNAEIAAAQAQKAANQVSENGRGEEADAAQEAEVVAQALPEEAEIVGHLGTDLEPEPSEVTSSETVQPVDGRVAEGNADEGDAVVVEESALALGQQGTPGTSGHVPRTESTATDPYGLDPLPAALLTASVPDGSQLATSVAVAGSGPSSDDAAAHGLTPTADVSALVEEPRARTPSAPEGSLEEAIAGSSGKAEV